MDISYKMYQKLLDNLQLVYDSTGGQIFIYGPVRMPVSLNDEEFMFNWYTWIRGDHLPDEINSCQELLDNLSTINISHIQQSSVLTFGDFENASNALVRIHSICHTGDIFGSMKCDCGSQLKSSFKLIVQQGAGAIFYISNHEGRGIGLFNKAMTYTLQENGYNTLTANSALGFKADDRCYDEVSAVLKSLRQEKIQLLSNNPDKNEAIQSFGILVEKVVPLNGNTSRYNRDYLKTKSEFFNHNIDLTELDLIP